MAVMQLASDRSEFSAAETMKAAGITARQLRDWDAKGATRATRQGPEGWRRLSPSAAFAVVVCSAIRKQFGVPIEGLGFVTSCMLEDGTDRLRWCETTIAGLGWTTCLCTDLQGSFTICSDYQLWGLLTDGLLRADRQSGLIILTLNSLVNSVRDIAGLEPLAQSSAFYRRVREAEAEFAIRRSGASAISSSEAKLLRLVRKSPSQELHVHVLDGVIARVDVEEEQPAEVAGTLDRSQILASIAPGLYATVTIRKHNGRVASVSRRTPIKLDEMREDPDLDQPRM